MTLAKALGATKEEKLEKLFSKLPRNAFPTSVEMSSDYQPGVFSWDAKHVYFDFLGMGKPQRLTMRREDVEVTVEEGSFLLAPSPKDANLGARTEFVGDAHFVHTSPLWRKRAWNTVNEWCSTRGNSWVPLLPRIMDASDKAYARLTRSEGVYYFFSSPEGVPHHTLENGDLRVYVQRYLRHVALGDETHWLLAKNLTDETRTYLDVAWDMHLDGKQAEFR